MNQSRVPALAGPDNTGPPETLQFWMWDPETTSANHGEASGTGRDVAAETAFRGGRGASGWGRGTGEELREETHSDASQTLQSGSKENTVSSGKPPPAAP